MSLILYELRGADAARPFSPYAWRVRMALKHKGLDFETRPKPFTQIAAIAPEVGKTVPILVDGERTICDSWAIATYLEETYADRPTLFGGPGGLAAAKLVESWANASISARIVRMIVKDICDLLAPEDQAYFRPIREERFGMSLEEVQAGREERLADLATALLPMHLMLKSQPFIGGDSPLQSDYMLFGTFQWARITSAFELLEPGSPVAEWRERCLDLFDGYARAIPAA
ncbi:glutathione S-transferase family protein [Stappia sp. MMSF_3263]|uniref:glutathione S-transferase family protein n=1 Tax=Stappia sp. MMSF_3263 TaxID=3046693 RepID=UPI00273EA6B3|nr:glutathione S-transferase family protein [Stappia sp. MMSF_3263]